MKLFYKIYITFDIFPIILLPVVLLLLLLINDSLFLGSSLLYKFGNLSDIFRGDSKTFLLLSTGVLKLFDLVSLKSIGYINCYLLFFFTSGLLSFLTGELKILSSSSSSDFNDMIFILSWLLLKLFLVIFLISGDFWRGLLSIT